MQTACTTSSSTPCWVVLQHLSLVRFLELGLSVACVCTKFPELAYMNEGRVQFEVHQPLIAATARTPSSNPHTITMTKIIDRRALNAAFSLATVAIALLTGRPWTGRVSARIASCAPSNSSLATSRPSSGRLSAHGRPDAARAAGKGAAPGFVVADATIPGQRPPGHQGGPGDLVAELKRSFCETSFFLGKAGHRREAVEAWLVDLTTATQPSVAVPV